jgi:hypothetical protein
MYFLGDSSERPALGLQANYARSYAVFFSIPHTHTQPFTIFPAIR